MNEVVKNCGPVMVPPLAASASRRCCVELGPDLVLQREEVDGAELVLVERDREEQRHEAGEQDPPPERVPRASLSRPAAHEQADRDHDQAERPALGGPGADAEQGEDEQPPGRVSRRAAVSRRASQ